MRAIAYTALGDPDVLHETELPDPVAGSGEVVVRVEAAGVNPVDAKLRRGMRGATAPEAPRVPGNDGAGVITAVGPDVQDLRVGDSVVLYRAPGTYAEQIAVPASSVFFRPAAVDAVTGAAAGIPGSTAYQSIRSLGVRADDTVLIHGASGAVGRLAVQFALLQGARVIATASERRGDDLRALGAEPVVYGEGLADRVRALAPSGVTAALDCVGTDEALETSLALVPDAQRIVTIVRGADADRLGIRAFGGGSPHGLSSTQEAWRYEGVTLTLALLATGAFSVEQGPTLPLADAAEAHRLVEAGTPGKITLIP